MRWLLVLLMLLAPLGAHAKSIYAMGLERESQAYAATLAAWSPAGGTTQARR